jgi:tetratricopeptide (TPR) repeat protein
MYTPFKRTVSLAIDLWNRLRTRGSVGLRAVPLTALGLLLLLVVGGGAAEIYRILSSPATSTSPGRMSALALADAGALAQCERNLREARRQMREQPDDGPVCLRVASLEMRRSDLLALLTEEMQSHTAAGTSAPESRVNPQWRQHYLRGDPAGTLGRAARAAEAALRAPLDPPSRRRALLLLAAARAARGNYHGEVEALAEAARREPGEATLWLRLSEAYGRAHQFARAAAARDRGLALLDYGAAASYPGAAGESRSDH